MSEQPPVQFAAYPRESLAPYGSVEQLKSLGEGYYGLNTVFIVNILLGLMANYAYGAMGALGLVGIPVVFIAIAALTYPYNKKIAFGKGWSSGNAILASVLMGLNSALCCGIVGYVVMQQIAAKEMGRYGLRSRFLGIRKADWKAALLARSS